MALDEAGKAKSGPPPKPAGKSSRQQHHQNNKRKADQPAQRHDNRLGAATEPAADPAAKRRQTGKTAWQSAMSFEEMLEAPCKHHSGARPSTHTLRQCAITKRIMRGDVPPPPAPTPGAGQPPPPPPPPPAGGTMRDDAYPDQNMAYVHFTSLSNDKRIKRLLQKEVNTVVLAKPDFMHWSDRPVTWTREDHPTVMPSPGGYALVLNPTIIAWCTCKFSRVLINGGSSINILYHDRMTQLGLKAEDLEPTRTTFHDIVPGLSCSPIGRVQLNVLFGDSNHFRREPIWFEVVDLSSAYHTLLGRPALAKFMAVPHYAYLKMKMPGPKGLITITGDYRKSLK